MGVTLRTGSGFGPSGLQRTNLRLPGTRCDRLRASNSRPAQRKSSSVHAGRGCDTVREMKRAFVLLALAACGASQNSQASGNPQASAGSGDLECHEESSIGSSIPRQICKSKLQKDEERRGAQDFLGTARPTQPPPPNHY